MSILSDAIGAPSRGLAGRAAETIAAAGWHVREWRRRARSRAELAGYSYNERADLGYAAEIDDEIEKPFWRK